VLLDCQSLTRQGGVIDTLLAQFPTACDWQSESDPPYAFQMYLLWVNIQALNLVRQSKGLSTCGPAVSHLLVRARSVIDSSGACVCPDTFYFRPHCGESGSPNHLAASFLVAHGINHGINLSLSTPLEYLYYLTQIGLSVSPLSNNSLFLDYKRNPFPLFFRRGLNVTLSTDDPLQFHYTSSPLIEEYSIASQVRHKCLSLSLSLSLSLWFALVLWFSHMTAAMGILVGGFVGDCSS